MATNRSEDDWFAENVRLERERLALTQAALAARVRAHGLTNFHPTTVSRIEKGDRGVRLSEAAALSRALNVPVGELAGPRAHWLRPLSSLVREVGGERMKVVKAVRSLADSRTSLGMEMWQIESRDGEVPEVAASLWQQALEELDRSSPDAIAAFVHEVLLSPEARDVEHPEAP